MMAKIVHSAVYDRAADAPALRWRDRVSCARSLAQQRQHRLLCAAPQRTSVVEGVVYGGTSNGENGKSCSFGLVRIPPVLSRHRLNVLDTDF